MASEDENKKEKPEPIVIKNCTDLQRMKLEKLMKNPTKPVIIPERPKPKGVPSVPDFVRNVMGSSAGAGSGEFHVYRHLRRKEYARQKYMKEKGEREKLDEEYHMKLEANRLAAEAKTAKKRAKRLKRKQKGRNKKPKVEDSPQSESDSESEEELITSENTEVIKSEIEEQGKEDDNPEKPNEEKEIKESEPEIIENKSSEKRSFIDSESASEDLSNSNKVKDL